MIVKPSQKSLTLNMATWLSMACVTISVVVFGPANLAWASPADRFVERISADDSLPAEARELIQTTWKACDDRDGAEFIAQGLSVLVPAFRDGLDAFDADDYAQAVRLLTTLRTNENPFVATNAMVYEIKSLVAMERMREAGKLIEEVYQSTEWDLSTYTYYADEIAFLRGVCLLSDMQYKKAYKALDKFLKTNPDASQRLRLTAQQMLAELAGRKPESMGDVVDLMGYSRRRLAFGEANEPIQQRQTRIIELLEKLIDNAEESEQNSSSSSSSSGGQSEQQKQQQQNKDGPGSPKPQNQPMQKGRLSGGDAQDGSLREGRRANPADRWGSMPPAQREQILQALRDSFPSRYRQLVEQYYEELAKKP